MQPAIETLASVPTLGIRTTVTQDEIGDVIGRLTPELMEVAGPFVAGPVIARWYSWEGDRGVMELAAPLREARPSSGRIEAGELPAGPAAVFEHVGPYDGLAAAWDAAQAWLAKEGHTRGEGPWEEYVSDCRVMPPAELLTRIVIPLRTDPT